MDDDLEAVDKPPQHDGTLQVELDTAKQLIANLQTALSSARRIGAAVGILMASRKVTYDVAFATISRHSQLTNQRLRDLAEDIIETGTLL